MFHPPIEYQNFYSSTPAFYSRCRPIKRLYRRNKPMNPRRSGFSEVFREECEGGGGGREAFEFIGNAWATVYDRTVPSISMMNCRNVWIVLGLTDLKIISDAQLFLVSRRNNLIRLLRIYIFLLINSKNLGIEYVSHTLKIKLKLIFC